MHHLIIIISSLWSTSLLSYIQSAVSKARIELNVVHQIGYHSQRNCHDLFPGQGVGRKGRRRGFRDKSAFQFYSSLFMAYRKLFTIKQYINMNDNWNSQMRLHCNTNSAGEWGWLWVCACVCARTRARARVCVCLCAWLCMHEHACVYECVCVCVCMCARARVRVFMFM